MVDSKKACKICRRLRCERRFVERSRHQLEPAIACPLSDGEWRVTHAQTWMTALFDVRLRAAEAENEEIAEPLFRAFQIPRRVHRPQNVVAGYLAVKRFDQALESGRPDRFINVLLFH